MGMSLSRENDIKGWGHGVSRDEWIVSQKIYDSLKNRKILNIYNPSVIFADSSTDTGEP